MEKKKATSGNIRAHRRRKKKNIVGMTFNSLEAYISSVKSESFTPRYTLYNYAAICTRNITVYIVHIVAKYVFTTVRYYTIVQRQGQTVGNRGWGATK